ncbi:hypothetical protein V5H41_28860, partial [Salmonella enterica]
WIKDGVLHTERYAGGWAGSGYCNEKVLLILVRRSSLNMGGPLVGGLKMASCILNDTLVDGLEADIAMKRFC